MKKKKQNKKSFSTPQKTIIIVIISAFLVVIFAVISSFFLKPENLVKTKIEVLAREYYETYFYDKFFKSEDFLNLEKLDSQMKKYKTSGFPSVPLRQILLYENEKNADSAELIGSYCDENKTSVRFYPEYPYEKASYSMKFNYSCDF